MKFETIGFTPYKTESLKYGDREGQKVEKVRNFLFVEKRF